MTNFYQIKHKENGFNDAKVHVIVRRRQADPHYSIEPIIEDLAWLAYYVAAKRLNAYVQEHDRDEMVQEMLCEAVRSMDKFPYQNPMGAKQPAFAYFNVVMFHKGSDFLKKHRRHGKVQTQIAEDFDVQGLEDIELPPESFSKVATRIFKLSGKEFFGIPRKDQRLSEALRQTAETGEVARLSKKRDVGRYYQAIMMIVLNKDHVPQDDVPLTPRNRVLALFIGTKRAKQWQFLAALMDGAVDYNPG